MLNLMIIYLSIYFWIYCFPAVLLVYGNLYDLVVTVKSSLLICAVIL